MPRDLAIRCELLGSFTQTYAQRHRAQAVGESRQALEDLYASALPAVQELVGSDVVTRADLPDLDAISRTV